MIPYSLSKIFLFRQVDIVMSAQNLQMLMFLSILIHKQHIKGWYTKVGNIWFATSDLNATPIKGPETPKPQT